MGLFQRTSGRDGPDSKVDKFFANIEAKLRLEVSFVKFKQEP